MSEAKLNVQGLARRDEGLKGLKGLCSYIIPDEGRAFLSMDLGAGEPTCTAHYSQDPRYFYASVGGIGKEPYVDDSGVLMIDDVYIMFMSQTPIGAPIIQAALAKDWPEGTFAKQWVKNSKPIKSMVKESRQIHKMLVLALLYGLGVVKMQKQLQEQFGIDMNPKQCKDVYNGFWLTFPLVKALVNKCTTKAAEKGFIANEFGYRVTFPMGPKGFEYTHKACNYLIQSTVSGIMHMFNYAFFQLAHEAGVYIEFITVIHDETVVSVAKSDIDKLKTIQEKAVLSLNNRLKWSVPIRVGFNIGEDFYEMKGD
jgi:hypothetical protein